MLRAGLSQATLPVRSSRQLATPHRACPQHPPLRRLVLLRSATQASAAGAPFILAPEVTSPPSAAHPLNLWAHWITWWTLVSPTPHDASERPGSSELLPLVRKIWGLCHGEVALIVSALMFLLAAAACELCIPHFATKCIFAAGEAKSAGLVAGYIKTLSILVLFYGVSSAVRGICFTVLNNRMIRKLRSQLFQRLIRRETAFFDATDTGSLTSRLQSDCQAVAKCIATNLNIALRNFIQAAGGGVYLYVLSPHLFATTLALSGVLWAVTLVYGNYNRRTQKVYQDVLAASNSVAEEVLSLSRLVRTFGTEEREEKRYGSWLQRLYDVGLRQASGYGLFVMVGHAATYSSKVIALLLGCAMVLRGELSAEQLTNFVFYVEFVTYASLNVCDEFTELMEVVGASERVLKLLDAQPAAQIASGQRLPSFSGRVDFEDVVFSYASRPNLVALGGVNLSLRPGKVVALVGLSGSGKTTLVALLQRLYDPVGGRLLVDGVDLRDLDANWYRAQIGVVTQEPRLFSTSIAENIAYGCELRQQRPLSASSASGEQSSSSSSGDAAAAGPSSEELPGVPPTMEEIMTAARAANAHTFIMALPQGYDTPVSDKLLSGGQKQRIALARALVRRPRLLVLDEATSALDAESESQVQQALDRAMVADDRAVVVIAHRLTTVRNADTIVVMDRGQIVEQGSHNQLMDGKGIYWQLVCRQQWGIDPTSSPAAIAAAAASSSSSSGANGSNSSPLSTSAPLPDTSTSSASSHSGSPSSSGNGAPTPSSSFSLPSPAALSGFAGDRQGGWDAGDSGDVGPDAAQSGRALRSLAQNAGAGRSVSPATLSDALLLRPGEPLPAGVALALVDGAGRLLANPLEVLSSGECELDGGCSDNERDGDEPHYGRRELSAEEGGEVDVEREEYLFKT